MCCILVMVVEFGKYIPTVDGHLSLFDYMQIKLTYLVFISLGIDV